MSSAVLASLRRRGVRLVRDGDDLIVEAPRGVVSPEEKAALREDKPTVLSALERESEILSLTLSQFEQQHHAIEVLVPGFDKTLWFAPTEAHAGRLAADGVSRGRIWTVAELRNVTRFDNHTLVRIARLKAEFGAEIVGIVSGDEAPQHG